jgi:hypothetical protein
MYARVDATYHANTSVLPATHAIASVKVVTLAKAATDAKADAKQTAKADANHAKCHAK